MEYNLAGLRRRVIIDKLDDGDFDPTVVDNFINDTQRDIFTRYELPFMEKIFSGVIPAGTTMFKIPDDVGQIQSQIISAQGTTPRDIGQRYIDFKTFNRIYPVPTANQPGPIFRWTLYAGNMITAQPTDLEYTMTLYYTKKPKTLKAAGDVPELPEEFAEALVLGAYIRVLEREDGSTETSRGFEGKYDRLLTSLVNKYGFRKADGPIVMKNGHNRVTSGFNTTPNGLVQKSY